MTSRDPSRNRHGSHEVERPKNLLMELDQGTLIRSSTEGRDPDEVTIVRDEADQIDGGGSLYGGRNAATIGGVTVEIEEATVGHRPAPTSVGCPRPLADVDAPAVYRQSPS
ncbi:MAG: hypothetical protein ACRDR6_25660 [Pseudonocardiaceae bacterium]